MKSNSFRYIRYINNGPANYGVINELLRDAANEIANPEIPRSKGRVPLNVILSLVNGVLVGGSGGNGSSGLSNLNIGIQPSLSGNYEYKNPEFIEVDNGYVKKPRGGNDPRVRAFDRAMDLGIYTIYGSKQNITNNTDLYIPNNNTPPPSPPPGNLTAGEVVEEEIKPSSEIYVEKRKKKLDDFSGAYIREAAGGIVELIDPYSYSKRITMKELENRLYNETLNDNRGWFSKVKGFFKKGIDWIFSRKTYYDILVIIYNFLRECVVENVFENKVVLVNLATIMAEALMPEFAHVFRLFSVILSILLPFMKDVGDYTEFQFNKAVIKELIAGGVTTLTKRQFKKIFLSEDDYEKAVAQGFNEDTYTKVAQGAMGLKKKMNAYGKYLTDPKILDKFELFADMENQQILNALKYKAQTEFNGLDIVRDRGGTATDVAIADDGASLLNQYRPQAELLTGFIVNMLQDAAGADGEKVRDAYQKKLERLVEDSRNKGNRFNEDL